MTQSDYPIYTLDAIHEDICFLVSYFFYDTRKKKEYSLAEVSKKTGISNGMIKMFLELIFRRC